MPLGHARWHRYTSTVVADSDRAAATPHRPQKQAKEMHGRAKRLCCCREETQWCRSGDRVAEVPSNRKTKKNQAVRAPAPQQATVPATDLG